MRKELLLHFRFATAPFDGVDVKTVSFFAELPVKGHFRLPVKLPAKRTLPYPCGNSSLLSNLLATVWALSHTPLAQGVCSCAV